MTLLPSNFDSLSALDKRSAIETATGLTWDEYSVLPSELKTQMLLTLKGDTVQSVTSDMLSAAKSDATASKISGFFSGLGTGLTIPLVLGIGVAVWIFLPGIKSLPKQLKKAVA